MTYHIVKIPDGVSCLHENRGKCKMAKYAGHLESYNCRLFGVLLKGGERPLKCEKCIATAKREKKEDEKGN